MVSNLLALNTLNISISTNSDGSRNLVLTSPNCKALSIRFNDAEASTVDAEIVKHVMANTSKESSINTSEDEAQSVSTQSNEPKSASTGAADDIAKTFGL